MRIRNLLTIILVIFIASNCYAATVILTCNVGGATLEYRTNENLTWQTSSFPKVLACRRYEYLMVKVTAPGYEDFEYGYDVNNSGMNNFVITLQPEDPNPYSVALFGIGGQIVSKRGLTILPNTYKILYRNITTYKKTDAAQVSQDSNYNTTDGVFSGVFANLATNRAAAVGDKIAIMVMNSSMTRVYGYAVKVLTDEDVSNCGIFVTILVR
jgi:hypothetical protein